MTRSTAPRSPPTIRARECCSSAAGPAWLRTRSRAPTRVRKVLQHSSSPSWSRTDCWTLTARWRTTGPNSLPTERHAITVREALSHRAGLLGVEGGFALSEFTTPDAAGKLAASPPLWRPGRHVRIPRTDHRHHHGGTLPPRRRQYPPGAVRFPHPAAVRRRLLPGAPGGAGAPLPGRAVHRRPRPALAGSAGT